MDQHTGPTAMARPGGGQHAGGAEASWEAAAASVLRKAGRLAADAPDDAVWDRLARTTVEGLVVPPLGTPQGAAGSATAAAVDAPPGANPFLRGTRAPAGDDGAWDVRVLVADPDASSAHRSALADLEGGATSLWLRVGDGGTAVADLAEVLDAVHLDMAPVVFQSGSPDADAAVAQAFARLARARSVAPHHTSSLGADPVGTVARAGLGQGGLGQRGLVGGEAAGPELGGAWPAAPEPDRSAAASSGDAEVALSRLPEIAALAIELGIGAIAVDGTVAHENGAGDAGEIGYTLAAGATYLRALTDAGVDVDTACELMEFRYAVTDDQFASIAKLRAARLAWHRVAELSGARPPARAQRQHAVTSSAMLTRYDPWVNLLRTTVAAFAAGVGGADVVTVLPFDSALGIPEEFGRRMARNISALLLGESHVGVVADPAGGAYAVEMLTDQIAQRAWEEFGRIESSGGILAAVADGSLAQRISATRAERDRRIATRRQPITGVSQFPNPGEQLPQRRPAQALSSASRWAEPFEMMRDHPATEPVLMVTIGTPAAASARALFARNLLAAGGIAVCEPGPHADLATAVTDSGCHTVVLVGSDAGYADGLESAAAAVRRAGAAAVFLAGRPAEVLSSLPEGLIDRSVAAGDDVLDFLRVVRAALGSAR